LIPNRKRELVSDAGNCRACARTGSTDHDSLRRTQSLNEPDKSRVILIAGKSKPHREPDLVSLVNDFAP